MISLIFLILAFLCFSLDTFGATVDKINLQSLGLAFFAASFISF